MDDGYKKLFKHLAKGKDADLSSVRLDRLVGRSRDQKCPECTSTNIDRTCQTLWGDDDPVWTGWYCHNCGHWWPVGRNHEEESC